MKHLFLAASTALFATAGNVSAHEFLLGDLVIDHPMAFETPPSARTGGGYFSITNNGPDPDRLIEVRAGFPRQMLHTTDVVDGIARMSHVDAIEIPPGETLTMEPGGLHVMFMGLDGDPFEPGEEIPATLVFENAGEVDVVFNVEARRGGEADHSGHGTD